MAAVLTFLGVIIFFGLYLAPIWVALARKSPYLFLAVVTHEKRAVQLLQEVEGRVRPPQWQGLLRCVPMRHS